MEFRFWWGTEELLPTEMWGNTGEAGFNSHLVDFLAVGSWTSHLITLSFRVLSRKMSIKNNTYINAVIAEIK